MPDLFFGYGGQNYARFLTYFSIFPANLDPTHSGAKELLMRGAFSAAWSDIPGNCCAVDRTIKKKL